MPTDYTNNDDNYVMGYERPGYNTPFPIDQRPYRSVSREVTFNQTRSNANANTKDSDNVLNLTLKPGNPFSSTSECGDVQKRYADSLAELELEMKEKQA